ncbi:MAG: metal-dependent hydrolase [archaeon]
MLWETHILFAIVVGVYGAQKGYFEPGLLFVIFLALGALLPDIDTPKSKLGRKVRPLSDIISWLAGHRGWIHSFSGFAVAMVIVGMLSLAFAERIFLPFFAGYMSHLALDAMTKEGVALFYPFWNKKISGPIRTGSLTEKILFAIILFAGLSIFY